MKSKKYSELERCVIREICSYVIEKLADGNAEKADSIIRSFGITRVECDSDTVHIEVTRPGLIIGLKGTIIIGMIDFLKIKTNNSNLKIEIVENTINNYMMNFTKFTEEGYDTMYW